jgi:hypothetical protein
MTHIIWTDEKKEAVISAIEKIIKEKNWTAGERLIQSDSTYIDLPEMFADLIDDVIQPEHVED